LRFSRALALGCCRSRLPGAPRGDLHRHCQADLDGFDLPANVHVAADNRDGPNSWALRDPTADRAGAADAECRWASALNLEGRVERRHHPPGDGFL
jgi:hypothetical protein